MSIQRFTLVSRVCVASFLVISISSTYEKDKFDAKISSQMVVRMIEEADIGPMRWD
jgi:hypothetical protein